MHFRFLFPKNSTEEMQEKKKKIFQNELVRQFPSSWLWLLHHRVHHTGYIISYISFQSPACWLCEMDEWTSANLWRSNSISTDTVFYGSFIFITLLISLTSFHFSDCLQIQLHNREHLCQIGMTVCLFVEHVFG